MVIAIIGVLSAVILASLGVARDRGRVAAGLRFELSLKHTTGDQLLGQWTFDECAGSVAEDASGFNNAGLLMSSPSWSNETPKNVGCSLALNGSSSYVDIGNSSTLYATQFTVSAWVYPTNLRNEYDPILSDADTTETRFNYYLGIQRNGVPGGPLVYAVVVNNAGASAQVKDTQSLMNNKWYHIAVTYDGSTLKLYRDGTLAAATTVSLVPSDQGQSFAIGRFGSEVGYNFQGSIDEVRVYGKAFNTTAVRDIYEESAPRFALET